MDKNEKHVCKNCGFEAKHRQALQYHIRRQHAENSENSYIRHYCDICEYSALFKSTLSRHWTNVHSKLKPFKCAVAGCNKSYGMAAILKRHEQNSHIEKNQYLTCDICDKSFPSKVKLDAHAQIHTKTKNVVIRESCATCGQTYASKASLKSHINEVHKTIRDFKCEECDYAGVSKRRLAEHKMAKHTRPDLKTMFKCQLCEKTYTFKKHLSEHIKNIHENSLKKFHCEADGCQYSTNQPSMMQNHYTAVHLKLKPFSCNFCSFTASTSDAVKRHEKRVHQKIKNYLCNFADCDKSFVTKHELTKHQNTHKLEKDLSCTECDFKCKSMKSLKSHKEGWHSKNPDIWRCDFRDDVGVTCQKVFRAKRYLMSHQKMIHQTATKFKCDVCDYMTIYRKSMQDHMENLHGSMEKNKKCDECDYVTHRLRNLIRHGRRKHQIIRREECPICGKSLMNKETLRVHIEDVHKIDQLGIIKEYQCDKCPYATNNPRLLRSHVRKRHSIKAL